MHEARLDAYSNPGIWAALTFTDYLPNNGFLASKISEKILQWLQVICAKPDRIPKLSGLNGH